MEYSYKYDLRDGNFWHTSIKYRKYGSKTLVTLNQFDQIILQSLESLIENSDINQEVREYTVELYMLSIFNP